MNLKKAQLDLSFCQIPGEVASSEAAEWPGGERRNQTKMVVVAWFTAGARAPIERERSRQIMKRDKAGKIPPHQHKY